MIKNLIVIIMLSTILLGLVEASRDIDNINNPSKEYFIQNTYEETGAKNFVAGIYLDYRLLDSIFEASILLITVTGIVFMSKKDEDMY